MTGREGNPRRLLQTRINHDFSHRPVSFFGSEGWGFESLRARFLSQSVS
jgi:hypothetical protein